MIIGAGSQFPRNNSHCKLLCHFESDASDSSVGHTDTHTPTVNGSPTYGAGKFGNCIDFGSTNTDKYVTYPDSVDWDIPLGMKFTISFWYNLANNTHKATLLERKMTGATTQLIDMRYIGHVSPKALQVTINNSDYNYSIDLNADEWYHAALCNDSVNFLHFHNGILIQSISTETIVSDKMLSFGSKDDGGNYLSGKIDEFAWIKGECLWTRNFTPPNRAS